MLIVTIFFSCMQHNQQPIYFVFQLAPLFSSSDQFQCSSALQHRSCASEALPASFQAAPTIPELKILLSVLYKNTLS